MHMESKTLSVRIPRDEFKDLNKLSKDLGVGKSILLRDVLERGIRAKKLEIALERFRKGEITLWKAARLAEMPLTIFFDKLEEEGLEFHYTPRDVEEEFEDLL